MTDDQSSHAVGRRPAMQGYAELFEAMEDVDTIEALEAAVCLWDNYPEMSLAVESSDKWLRAEKLRHRQDLEGLHHQACRVLMRRAARLGLNPAALDEEGRVCLEMFRPITFDPYQPGLYGVRWFHNREAVYDQWPWCLGGWRDALPPRVYEAIRSGQEVYHRLIALTEIEEEATTERLAIVGKQVRRPGPRAVTNTSFQPMCGGQLLCLPDFSEVMLGVTRFVLSSGRAAVVRELVHEWEVRQAHDEPGVLGPTLVVASGSTGTELSKVFKSNKVTHPSWGGLVTELGRDPADRRQRRYGLNVRQPQFDGAGRRLEAVQ